GVRVDGAGEYRQDSRARFPMLRGVDGKRVVDLCGEVLKFQERQDVGGPAPPWALDVEEKVVETGSVELVSFEGAAGRVRGAAVPGVSGRQPAAGEIVIVQSQTDLL